MKRILITGANSYIGTSFEKWIAQWPAEYQIDTVGTRNGEWKTKNFSDYDVIFHVAGIAHIKETKENEHLYYDVNRDLAINVANKAKSEKVKQFVFLSSMSVYGLNEGIITKETLLKPKNAYGKSKLEAEKAIQSLGSKIFSIAILRPPMVYGEKCKGNYQMLSKFARITPIFPNIKNQRSMVYIYNLCSFIKLVVDNKYQGIFFPQNKEFVNPSQMVKIIAEMNGKNIMLVSLLNPIVHFFVRRLSAVNKVFGDLLYSQELSRLNEDYNEVSFLESILSTEKNVIL